MGPIALVVGELTAYLTVNNDDYRRGLREAKGDLTRFGADAGREADRSGRDTGGKLAQGMRQGFIRNSPLIAAGVAAGLTAGAPAILSAATGLFAGIGIVAAAQADDVQSAWLGAWQNIKRSTISEASAIEPVLIGLADRVSTYFDAMQGRLGDVFEAAAPQIEVFAGGVMDLAQNALPGLFRAVERGMPVTQGFADFLAKTGTGLTGFFDAMSEKAPEAGQAFSALGDIMGELLPLLGELLGQGAELATIVLPPLAKALGVVADVAEALGPVLPVIATGLLAMKVATSVTSGLNGLAGSLGDFAAKGGAASGVAGGLARGIGGVSSAAGPAGAAIGGTAAILVTYTQAAEAANDVSMALGRAFQVGGRQAEAAGEAIDRFSAVNEFMATGVGQTIGNISLLGYSLGELVPTTKENVAAYKDWVANLGPLAAAQEDVKVKTQALGQAIRDYGASSPEAAAAGRDLAAAEREAARAAEEQEGAIRGVTQAMVDQQNQARSAIDSQFAYENALDTLEDRQRELNEAMKSGSAEEQSDAFRGLEQQAYAVAESYAQMKADQSGLTQGTVEYDQYLNGQLLGRLKVLQQEAGPKMAAALGEQIKSLEDAGVETISLKELADQLGISLDELTNKDVKPTFDADDKPLTGKIEAAGKRLEGLDGKKPTPTFDADDGPFSGKFARTMDRVGQIDKQKPTPTVSADDGPFSSKFGSVMARVGTIGKQKPTPTVNANDAPFTGKYIGVMGKIEAIRRQRPNPVITALDNATSTIGKIIGAIAGVKSKTVTITTISQSLSAKASWAATGGRVGGLPIRGLSDGGKVDGPGGPTDDRVGPFLGSRALLFFSDDEYVVKARSALGYGDRKMDAVNDGRAIVMLPEEMPRVRALSGGGTVGGGGATTTAGRGDTGGGLHVHFDGPVLADRRSLRKTAEALHSEFRAIDRGRT